MSANEEIVISDVDEPTSDVDVDLYEEPECLELIEECVADDDDSQAELKVVDSTAAADDEAEDLFNIGEAEAASSAAVAPADAKNGAKARPEPSAATAAAAATTTASVVKSTAAVDSRSQRRHSCYVGNLTWWTTDLDIEKALNQIDINDLVDVRFHENRVNGQSKGFAVVSFGTDTSLRKCLESLSTQTINDVTPIVMPYSKQSLLSLESTNAKKMTNDRPAPRPLMADDKPPSPLFLGTVRLDTLISNANRDAARSMNRGGGGGASSSYGRNSRTSHLPSLLSTNISLPMPPNRSMGPLGAATLPPPPPVLVPPPNRPPPPPPGFGMAARPPPLTGLPPSAVPPPGSHINPNFYPGLAAASVHLSHYGDPMSGDGEYEEAVNRNRIVASSAITRAVADAATGNFGTAIETLVTAVTMLRSSKVAHDERNRILVSSLQDTLRGIEKQSYGNSGRRSRQSRERSHNRDYRKRRGDRSRSRSRERHGMDNYSPRRKRY